MCWKHLPSLQYSFLHFVEPPRKKRRGGGVYPDSFDCLPGFGYQFEFTSLCTTLLLSKGQGVLFQLPLSARNSVDYCLIFLIFFELRHGQMLNKRQSTLRMAVKWSVLLLSTSSLELGAYNIVILSSGMRRGIPGRCLLCNWEFGTDSSVGGRSWL